MKKKYVIGLSILSLFTLVGCSFLNTSSTINSSTYISSEVSNENTISSNVESSSESYVSYESSETYSSEVVTSENNSEDTTISSSEETSYIDYEYNSSITVNEPDEIIQEDNTGEFVISTKDGSFSKNGNIYTLEAAGTYVVSGYLAGQIVVNATTNDEVVIELNNVTIEYDSDSPIKALVADKVEISAKSGTNNTINDNRSAKTSDTTTLGEGAIYASTDLKLKGSGTLVVNGNYNNAVHTSKDLTIQKLALKAIGYNNALKGNDSVVINSGTIQAYAKTGNGIKTENSDISSKGNQRGTIMINGGEIYVDSLHDAFDASYNVEIDETDSEVPTSITIKTGTQATYYNRSTFKADSEKGIKAINNIIINKGSITIAASDDAIHANYGTTLENGNKGLGNITINDGLIQVASGDDGLHADNTLTINGGKIVVTGATEGFEANYININGGYSYIYGTDDGVNCSKKSFSNCEFNMTGGYLDVAVRSGDTDGIDSNGNVTISGGVIVTRGSPGTTGSNMSTGLDVDGTCNMTGGTLIAFNGLEKTPSTNSGIYLATTSSSTSMGMGGFTPGGGRPGQPGSSSSSKYTFQAGNYTLSGNGIEISFTNDYQYGNFLIYSSSISSNATYTLSRNNSTLLSWSQTSTSVTIS